jgi:L-alanine-DL-glutamate epimerase-like enolase superfamily enzyme
MKIRSVKLHALSVPRQYATVIAQAGGTARPTVERSHFYFVEASADDGRTGWGEISDVPPDELPADRAAYEALLGDLLRGRSVWDVQRLHHDVRQHLDLQRGSLGRYTACALEMALYDLQAQAAGVPIYNLLGGAVRREVRISWVAYIREDLDLIREEIRQRCREGFTAFKLKVGVNIDLDEARLAAAREVAGPRASIKVDANAGWSVDEAPRHIRRLARYDLAGVETPVPRDNPADIAAVRRQVNVPILEHVDNAAYGLALLRAEAVDCFNIATTNAGGIYPARHIAALAEAAGVGVLLGSTVELGPGTLYQLHLAATIANLTLPSDLIGPGMYRDDVLQQPLKYEAGTLRIPQGPGLGGIISRQKLHALARGA